VPAVELSSSTSSRLTYVAQAADRTVSEAPSPSDLSPQPSPAPNAPSRSMTPPSVPIAPDYPALPLYRSPLPFGPSGTPSLLQYLSCDPYSCPQIWRGHEAQLAAELAKKCTPPGCATCGGRCGTTMLYGSACTTCASTREGRL
jgi:hypothetical protein